MKGATNEKIFAGSFPCYNAGDQRPVSSGPDRETESPPGVRERLYRPTLQLSGRLFLSNQRH